MDRPTFTVHLNASDHLANRVRLAANLALACDAHLVGLASTLYPAPPYMTCIGSDAQALLAEYRQRSIDRLDKVFETFDSVAAGVGLSSRERRLTDDDIGVALCSHGRYSDLLIVSQIDPREPATESSVLPEFVLLNSGRPVLVCPYGLGAAEVGRRCLVAWDGSLEAVRAINGALLVLRRANKVVLTVVNPRTDYGGHGDDPGADMALYLARKGVEVEVDCRYIASSRVGDALLAQAEERDSDLIIAGAYGHSHLREIVLGGVTQTLLDQTVTATLMCH